MRKKIFQSVIACWSALVLGAGVCRAQGNSTASSGGSNAASGSSTSGSADHGGDRPQHMGWNQFQHQASQRLSAMVRDSGNTKGAADFRAQFLANMHNVPAAQRENVMNALRTLHEGIRAGDIQLSSRDELRGTGDGSAFMKANTGLFDSSVTSEERATLQALSTLQQTGFFDKGTVGYAAGEAAGKLLAANPAGNDSGGSQPSPGQGTASPEGHAPGSPGSASGANGISQSGLQTADTLTGGQNPYVKSLLADSYLRSGDRDRAIQAATAAAALKPDYARPQVVLAQAHFQNGDYAAAKAAAAKALDIDPSNAGAGSVLKLIGGRDRPNTARADAGVPLGAADRAERGMSASDALPSPQILKGSAARADSAAAARLASQAERLYNGGDYAAAAERSRRALELNPRSGAALMTRIQALVRQGKKEDALRALDEALAADPENTRLLLARANLLNILKRPAEALRDARRALSMDPRDAVALVNEAWALDALGRHTESIASLAKAAAINPAKYGELYEQAKRLREGELAALLAGEAVAAKPEDKKPSDLYFGLSKATALALSFAAGGLMVCGGLLHMGMRRWREQLGRALTKVTGKTASLGHAGGSASGWASGGMVGPYRLKRRLGRGGMGEVYEAVDTALDRRVAVKRMLPAIRDDAVERERFLREARLAASLHHPSIVGIYQVVDEGRDSYLVFEYVDGKTVSELLLHREKLPFAEAEGVVRRVAEGLDYAHSKGVIHRDLKPSNIMVDRERQVKVMDFGVAKLAQGPAKDATVSRTVVGTPPYMPPEQEQGMACAASDVYSLGVCLYRMLTGTYPFSGDPAAISAAKMAKTYAPASQLVQGLPEGLDAVLDKALEPVPDRRWRTAGDFARSLRALTRPG